MLLSKIIIEFLLATSGAAMALEQATDWSTGSTISVKGIDGQYKEYTIGVPSFPIHVNGIEIAPNTTIEEYSSAIKTARSTPMSEIIPRELDQVDRRQLPYGSINTNDPYIRNRIQGLLCHVNGWVATHANRVMDTAWIVGSWRQSRWITCFMLQEHNSLELYWCNDMSYRHHIHTDILAAYGYHIGNYCRKHTCWPESVTGQVFDKAGFNLFIRKNNNVCN